MQTAKQKEQLRLSDVLWRDHIRIQINFKGIPVVQLLKRWFASPCLKPFEHAMYTDHKIEKTTYQTTNAANEVRLLSSVLRQTKGAYSQLHSI